MSASAYAQVIYGIRLDQELLRVEDGTKWACRNNEQHKIIIGKNYCPDCGGTIRSVPNMVASKAVRDYAKAQKISLDKAIDHLSPFQYHCYVADKDAWVFGKQIIDAGSYDGMVSFDPSAQDFTKLNKIFLEIGLDPATAKYYVVIELH